LDGIRYGEEALIFSWSADGDAWTGRELVMGFIRGCVEREYFLLCHPSAALQAIMALLQKTDSSCIFF
jgi:hypothetical protein